MIWMMFGLKACDTCRKARRWLDSQGVAYDFRDLRQVPPTRALLQHWLEAVGQEKLLNRRSTTWRELPDSLRDKAGARAAPEDMLDLLAQRPALIRRPLFQRDATILIGFDSATRKVLADSSAPNQNR